MIEQEPLKVTTARTGPTAVLTLTGELDLHASDALGNAVDDALAAPDLRLVEIDAGGLTFVDSSGLRTLLTARERAQDQEVELTLSQVSPALARLLDMTGLTEVFDLPG